jgi:hypothetical protein
VCLSIKQSLADNIFTLPHRIASPCLSHCPRALIATVHGGSITLPGNSTDLFTHACPHAGLRTRGSANPPTARGAQWRPSLAHAAAHRLVEGAQASSNFGLDVVPGLRRRGVPSSCLTLQVPGDDDDAISIGETMPLAVRCSQLSLTAIPTPLPAAAIYLCAAYIYIYIYIYIYFKT